MRVQIWGAIKHFEREGDEGTSKDVFPYDISDAKLDVIAKIYVDDKGKEYPENLDTNCH